MSYDEDIFLIDDEKQPLMPILVSSILAVITTVVLVWVFFETIRRVQIGDYSYFVILLVFTLGAALVAYSIIRKESQEDNL
jgi:hypothetical protein